MLGKLMKYEFKATWKLLVPMYIFLVVMSILAFFTVRLTFFETMHNNELLELTSAFVLVAYIMSMFITIMATSIYLIYRFYKSVYSDEGYLLHTLPVDKHHIIISKTLVSFIWVVINSLIIYMSIIFLFASNKEAFEGLKWALNIFIDIWNSYDSVNAFTVFMTIVAVFVSIIAKILKITACISLGQLSPDHKVLVSFGIYYGIYVLQRIIAMIYFAVIALSARVNDSFSGVLFGMNWGYSLIGGLIGCVIFYYLTWYVMEKRLNLD